ncbi:hypothetical protein HYFRA_00000837 [Hymenoscyphus fraxineus]|uniref:Myb-like DNA-binding domain-containing protein n=1 Tax=Hymenoscyphus fraxineus TaxID=746836 RepID=A0A9N9PGR4_9HELO|nr:hypothetical protein HYFRA_00000837 [Hymenoscyphus fraxineus]
MAEIGQSHAKFFYIILSNMKNKPDVDWTAVATQAGLKNSKVAQTRFGQIKKKIEETKGGGGDGHALVEEKKASPRKRKAAAKVKDESDEDAGSEGDQEDTPSPSKRGRLGKAKTMTEKFQTGLDLDDVDDDEPDFRYC